MARYFLGLPSNPPTGCDTTLGAFFYTDTSVRYPILQHIARYLCGTPGKQARKSFAILSLKASRDMKSIAAGPLSCQEFLRKTCVPALSDCIKLNLWPSGQVSVQSENFDLLCADNGCSHEPKINKQTKAFKATRTSQSNKASSNIQVQFLEKEPPKIRKNCTGERNFMDKTILWTSGRF